LKELNFNVQGEKEAAAEMFRKIATAYEV